jgi:sec-independent protein translocase protein TatB
MFGLGWTEILVIAAIAVLVVPPKDLPGLMRGFGRTMGKMRRMASDFQRELESAVRDEELDKLRKQVTDIGKDTDRQLRAAVRPKEIEHLRRDMDDIGRETSRNLSEAGKRYQRPKERNTTVDKAGVESGPPMTPTSEADETASAEPANEPAADEPPAAAPASAKS